jgi:glutathione S-transferase
MTSSKPLLVYWDIRALAEPIRLLLNYVGQEFEDKRIPFGDMGPSLMEHWTNQKYSHGLDFPNLPYYVEGDFKISQSIAILNHLGRKHNLYGDTLEDKARIDMVAQTVNDLRWSAWVVYNDKDFHKIKGEWKKSIPGKWSEMNKFLEGKEYVLGSKISWVDFLLYESMEWFRQFAMDVFQDAPELANLNQFQKRIEALPQIKTYLNSDRFKDRLFAPIVNFGYSKDPDFKPMPFSYRNFVAKYPLDPL